MISPRSPLLASSLLLVSIAACNSEAQPPVATDAHTGLDAIRSDRSASAETGPAVGDGGDGPPARDLSLGDAPRGAVIRCTPQRAPMTKLNSVCAQASVVLDLSASSAPKCTVQSGVARTAKPMMLFTRQDDPCAGPGISEIVFFVSTHKTITFLSVAPKGVIEKSDTTTLREIPYRMVIDTIFALRSDPKKRYWMRLRGGKKMEILELKSL